MPRLNRDARIKAREAETGRGMTEHGQHLASIKKATEDGRRHPLPCTDTTCVWHHEQASG